MKIIKISLVLALTAALNSTAAENAIDDGLSHSIELLEQSRLATSSHVREEGTYGDQALNCMEGYANSILESLTLDNRKLLKRQNSHGSIKNHIDTYLEQSESIRKELLNSKELFGRRSPSTMTDVYKKLEGLEDKNGFIYHQINVAKSEEQEAIQKQKKAAELQQAQLLIAQWEKEFANPTAALVDDTYEKIQKQLRSDFIDSPEKARLTALLGYINENYESNYCDAHYCTFWNRKTN